MTVNKNDVITIPKWLVIFLLPMIVSIVTGYGFYTASHAKLEQRVQQIELENAKKINKAESDLMMTNFQMQFDNLNKNLLNIGNKLDQHINKSK